MSILFAPIKVGDLQLENRFVRSATHEGLATERGFVTDELIKRYRRLAREVSCGTVLESPWSMIRGTVPVKEMLRAFAWWQRPLVRMILNQDVGKFELKDGYNLDLAREIRASLDGVPLAVVGGMRRVSHMEAVLESEQADLISMSRPFLREPYLIRRIREGKTDAATCESCNRCAAAQVNDMAVRCYCKSFPQ